MTVVHLDMGNTYYSMEDVTNTIVQWETYLQKEPNNPQAENIRKALEALRRKDFMFPSQKKRLAEANAAKNADQRKKQ
jgi:hypothetical protein